MQLNFEDTEAYLNKRRTKKPAAAVIALLAVTALALALVFLRFSDAAQPQLMKTSNEDAGHVIAASKDETVPGNPQRLRNSVGTITFLSDTSDAPEDAADASAAGDGSVLYWEKPKADGTYAVYYAAEGGVTANPDSSSFFSGYVNLTALRFNNSFHTDRVTNMRQMFFACHSLRTIDLSDFDTGNVTDMSGMFSRCGELQKLDLSGLDTGNVTDMSYMFTRCGSLKTIDLSGLDTGRVTNMQAMFSYCFDLTEVHLGGLDLAEVRDISYLFSCCGALEAVNLHCFNDSPLEHAESMFLCCDRLSSIGSNLDLIANELIYMPEPQYPAEWNEREEAS